MIRSKGWNRRGDIALLIDEALGTEKMSRYYFDIKNGHRLVDPSGLDCESDSAAMRSAAAIARQIAADATRSQPRHISVLDSNRKEIGKVPVSTHSKEKYVGSK
jgi:hypothetical protein